MNHEASAATPAAWERVAVQHGESMVLFRPRRERVRNPRTGEVLTRLVLETSDWVNVVACTPDRRIVLVRQYRFGSGEVTTEVPGGVVEPGEAPQATAERELREETGYTAACWTYLGAVRPNPAFHDNRCHHFLAEGAVRTHVQEQDRGEDIVVLTMSLDEVRAAIARGELDHSLVVTALCRVLDVRQIDLATRPTVGGSATGPAPVPGAVPPGDDPGEAPT